MNATDVARLKYCPLKDVAAGASVPFWDSYTKEIHGTMERQAVEFLYKCVNHQIKRRLFKEAF